MLVRWTGVNVLRDLVTYQLPLLALLLASSSFAALEPATAESIGSSDRTVISDVFLEPSTGLIAAEMLGVFPPGGGGAPPSTNRRGRKVLPLIGGLERDVRGGLGVSMDASSPLDEDADDLTPRVGPVVVGTLKRFPV